MGEGHVSSPRVTVLFERKVAGSKTLYCKAMLKSRKQAKNTPILECTVFRFHDTLMGAFRAVPRAQRLPSVPTAGSGEHGDGM